MTSPRGCEFSKPGGGQEALTDCFGAEDVKRKQELAERKTKKQQRRQQKAVAAAAATFKSTSSSAAPGTASKPTPAGPIAFLFPGQGSQALGMLKVLLLTQALCKARVVCHPSSGSFRYPSGDIEWHCHQMAVPYQTFTLLHLTQICVVSFERSLS